MVYIVYTLKIIV